MRTHAAPFISAVLALGALTAGVGTLSSAASAATAATPAITVIVPLPATVTTPTASFEVRIDGTTAAQDEAGYRWNATSEILTDGYTSDGARITQSRFLGGTAVFEVVPGRNGHHRITVGTRYASTSFEFDAAVPGLSSVPPPPANVRVETDRLSFPVSGVTASFSIRFVADEPFENAQRPEGVAFAYITAPEQEISTFYPAFVGNTTTWQDVTVKWVVGAPLTINATFGFDSTPFAEAVSYTKAFPLTVGFAAANVFALYPPSVILSCPKARRADPKARFTCTAALAMSGTGQIVPNQFSLVTQARSRVSPRGFGPWRVTSRVPVTLNGEAVAIPVEWRASAKPKSTLQIRTSVDEYPGIDPGKWCAGFGC